MSSLKPLSDGVGRMHELGRVVNQRELTLPTRELLEDRLSFFRWGRVGERLLLTNDAGDWAWVSDADFEDLLAGRIAVGHPTFPILQQKGFLRDGLDLDALAARVAKRNRHLLRGLHRHSLCLGVGDGDRSMAPETAERILDFALQSTAPELTIEFYSAGGDALRHLEAMRRLVEASLSPVRQAAGKGIRFCLQTDFSAMTEAAAEWILTNQIQVCFPLHGPAGLHDWSRKWGSGCPHAETLEWIKRLGKSASASGDANRADLFNARLTTTRRTLSEWREVIDEYVARGLRTISFRTLVRSSFSDEAWQHIGYSLPEFATMYRNALGYLLELNQRGVEIRERSACLILAKIFGAEDADAVEIQSPCASGIGAVAYSPEGRVFPSQEAQLLAETGDVIFDLGDVRDLTIPGLARHPTVRAIAAASLLDAQPLCSDCWNKPFCGFSPVRNYMEQGDLHGQRHRCTECREHMLVSRALFEVLGQGTDREAALRSWLSQ